MEKEGNKKKLFDVCIGNPPYQAENNETEWSKPIYPVFMEAAYQIADKVELITPARFLFNAGKTPKDWNKKMLDDEHFKVEKYWIDSTEIFPNADIKGGVAVHYRDGEMCFGAIETFTTYEELNSLLKNVRKKQCDTIDNYIYPYSSYAFTIKMPSIMPEIFDALPNKRILASNLFEKLDGILFFNNKPNDNYEYVQIYGRKNNERTYMWIRRDYIDVADNFEYWKVFVPAANGSGAIGEVLSTPVIGEPVIGEPVIGHNQTFISIGKFNTRNEAENCLKYIKTKFARALLGTLKITQNGKRDVYANIPLQDFTSSSDIDWNKSIHEIDLQLYKKYGLEQKEIDFIEAKVKEMS